MLDDARILPPAGRVKRDAAVDVARQFRQDQRREIVEIGGAEVTRPAAKLFASRARSPLRCADPKFNASRSANHPPSARLAA